MSDLQALIGAVLVPLALIASGVALGALILLIIIDGVWKIIE